MKALLMEKKVSEINPFLCEGYSIIEKARENKETHYSCPFYPCKYILNNNSENCWGCWVKKGQTCIPFSRL